MNYSKPKILLWASACIILISGIVYAVLAGMGKVFYVQVFDTFYIITNWYLTVFLTFLNFLLGAGYNYFEKVGRKTNHRLTMIHTVVTVICTFTCWITAFTLGRSISLNDGGLAKLFAVALAVLITVQALYFINLFSAALKK